MDFPTQLRQLRTDFLSGKPVKSLDFTLLRSCTWFQQSDLLANTVHADVCLQHGPLSRAYRTAFLRHCVSSLERSGSDVHDDLYTALAATLVASGGDEEEYAWKHFELWRAAGSNDSTTISIRQRLNIISSGTTGLHTWQAAGALAEWAIANSATLRGRRVLELGAGTGLTGLVVARMCQPKELRLTDGNESVCELLQANVARNLSEEERQRWGVRVEELDWERVGEMREDERPEVILAADVVYDSSLFGPLCRALDALFGQSGEAEEAEQCCAYLAATVRNADTLAQFLKQLDSLRFEHAEIADVPAPRVLYWDDTTPIKMFRITRRQR